MKSIMLSAHIPYYGEEPESKKSEQPVDQNK